MSYYKLLILFLTSAAAIFIDPIVELPTGKILGRQAITYANTTYYSFQRIPYAAPPVGLLRFKAPQPPQKWEGVLNATVLGVSCYQLEGNQPTDSDDCLFVNVYSPQLPEDDKELLPVMFFIHGGAFRQGTSMFAPPDIYVDNGIVLVTINYRLGAFGFLSTEDEVIPGNNGLKDQLLAIQWTHDNVHLFGGDPDKVTIFGQSAGSASVGYQMLNQNSEGLFRGAILESGSFLSPWTLQRNARKIAFQLGSLLNPEFNKNDSTALLELLQSVDASELDAASEQLSKNLTTEWQSILNQELLFAPVLEVKNPEAFLTKKMYGLLQAGNILKIPMMIGFNSEEGIFFNQDPQRLQKAVTVLDSNLDLLVPTDMRITDEELHANVSVTVRDIYTSGEPFGTNLGAAIKYSSDTGFTRSITKHAELYSKLAPTYFYQFSYDGILGNISVHYDGAESVGHSEEAFYIFCMDAGCSFNYVPESDQLTSRRLVKMWTNFAKFQDPTPEPIELLQNVTWPKISLDSGEFLYLNINETLEIYDHPKKEVLAQWNKIYEGLGYDDFDTY